LRVFDKILLLIAALVFLGGLWFGIRFLSSAGLEYTQASEPIDVTIDPIQEAVVGEPLPVQTLGKTRIYLFAQASYKLRGVLVSKRNYQRGPINRLAPWDYAMVWGKVPQHLKDIKFKQVVRFCLFRYKPGLQLDLKYIGEHFSNHHLIPANANIRRALRQGKKGMKVELEGFLVNVEAYQNNQLFTNWKSSLSRSDTGNGACEIIYVKRLRLEDKIFE